MQKITERQIIGMILGGLAPVTDDAWVNRLSMLFESDQESEEYAWLGASPSMREWIGGRQAHGMRENAMVLRNKKFEATLEILCDWLRRDKTGQIRQRVRELAEQANLHWADLLSGLIAGGEQSRAYDGQYYFDVDHAEGDSGLQSNRLSITLSALPVAISGTPSAPSPEAIQQCIIRAVAAILGFRNDRGGPMNENAREFVVMAPFSLWLAAKSALAMQHVGHGASTQMDLRDFSIQIVGNARLTPWTTRFAVFRADGANKPLIRQEEIPLQVTAIAEGSELEFSEDKHQYGVWASRNAGYGFWQSACLVIMS